MDKRLAEGPTPGPPASNGQRLVTAALVVGPLLAVAAAVPVLWGRVLHPRDVVLAVVLYAVTGHGVTVGFHRMFTHRSFTPARPLKIALGIAGSMAVEGSITSWVANHRRHHMFSDRDGDPHSPHRFGTGALAQLRGFGHAHVGWLFRGDDSPPERFAPDLLKDRDVAVLSRLFPLLAVASLGLPFLLGWGLSGSLVGGLTALLWAGLVRMAVLHHVTWSVNSVCHMFGRRPHDAKDESRNVAVLALVSMGESWHNFHHAFPASARHGRQGADRHLGRPDPAVRAPRLGDQGAVAARGAAVRGRRRRLSSGAHGQRRAPVAQRRVAGRRASTTPAAPAPTRLETRSQPVFS